jgi:hypothetical protein
VLALRPSSNIYLSRLFQLQNVQQIKLNELSFEQSIKFVCNRYEGVEGSREREEAGGRREEGGGRREEGGGRR